MYDDESRLSAEVAPESAAPPLQGVAFIVAAAVAGVANLIVSIDSSICNVSIPSIASGLGASPQEGTWVITSYAIAEAITVPLTGWLAQRFGPARCFAIATFAFGVASVLCGLSPNLGTLVLARVLQGLAGGPMIPLSQTLLVSIFPKKHSEYAVAIWAMTAVSGPCFGPIIGGYICDNWQWPWIFLLNAPLALIGGVCAWQLLTARDPKPQKLPVDLLGFILMVIWIGALQVTLDRGQELRWLESPFIVTLTVIAVIAFAAFLIWELTDANPIVDLRIFRHAGYSLVCILLCVAISGCVSWVLLISLWTQTNLGYTATYAGLFIAPNAIGLLLFSPVATWIANKMGTRAVICLGLLVIAVNVLWGTNFTRETTFEMIFVQQGIGGVGTALFFAPAMSLSLGFVPASEMTAATGLLHFLRTFAIAVATSLTVMMWENGTTLRRVEIVDQLNDSGVVRSFVKMGISAQQALRELDGIVQTEAVMKSTIDVFFVFALVMTLGAIAIWFAPRRRASSTTLRPASER
jgi:DHA2 family multidrug resistance protein